MLHMFLDRYSIKIRVLLYFLPVIVLSVVITGMLSHMVSVQQIRENTDDLLSDTVYQTSTYLNDKLTTVFEQLVSIQKNPDLNSALFDGREIRKIYSIDKDTYEINKGVNKYINNIYQTYFKMIDSIYISFNNGTQFSLQSDQIPRHIGVNLDEWIERYKSPDISYHWLNSHQDEVFDTVEERDVISTFTIVGDKNSQLKGLVLINIRSQYILDILKNVKLNPHGYLALISPDGIIYSKDTGSQYGLGDSELAFLRGQSGEAGSTYMKSTGGKKLFVVYNTVKVNQWVAAAVLPEEYILENTSKINYVSFGTILLMTILSSCIALIFAGSISKPIRYLSTQMKEVEAGNFDVDFGSRNSSREIATLANGLTSLIKTVKNLIERVRSEQEKKRKIELLALQSQINPHFLYNTLSSIKFLVDLGENKKASTMITAMTHLFTIGISRGKELITLREEIEHVRNYLIIQKMRYSRDFDFEIDVAEDILSCSIIKITLQPIVENSIYHGIKNKMEVGLIRISGEKRDGEIYIEVFDDGAGIEESSLKNLIESIGKDHIEENPITFGLRNVNQRLKLHFGNEYGLSVESVENEYTKVVVRLPYTK